MYRILACSLLLFLVPLVAVDPASAQSATQLESPGAAPSSPTELPPSFSESPERVHRVDRGLLIAGGAVLGVAWVQNLVGAAFGNLALYLATNPPNIDGDVLYGLSMIPLAGPFIYGGISLQSGIEWLAPFAFVGGAVQTLGAVLFIAGLIGNHEPAASSSSTAGQWQLLPSFGPQGGEISLRTQF